MARQREERDPRVGLLRPRRKLPADQQRQKPPLLPATAGRTDATPTRTVPSGIGRQRNAGSPGGQCGVCRRLVQLVRIMLTKWSSFETRDREAVTEHSRGQSAFFARRPRETIPQSIAPCKGAIKSNLRRAGSKAGQLFLLSNLLTAVLIPRRYEVLATLGPRKSSRGCPGQIPQDC